jgi:hypothetical protein
MSTPPQPPKGNMVLWDYIKPPLEDGSYRWHTQTKVTYGAGSAAAEQDLPEAIGYFNVEGPRFRIDASDVAGMFPPRNGHGGFNTTLPHIALYKRTLPWERELDPDENLWKGQTPPAWNDNVPWVALLLFEESECTIKQTIALSDALPKEVVTQLAAPPGTQIDTVSASSTLVQSIMPSLEELSLLVHDRQVNVDDKELNAAGGNGWFSVVMSNRVPEEGKKYVACLVSLEERWDVVPQQPPTETRQPPVIGQTNHHFREIDASPRAEILSPQSAGITRLPVSDFPITSAVPSQSLLQPTKGSIISTYGGLQVVGDPGRIIFQFQTTFILLFSWKFECTTAGTFEELMQGLNVQMFGNPNTQDKPALTDTGHLQMKVSDRAGETEATFYRGPLVPFQLTRDPLGPYHSADQCRRGSIETGGEDISYAAAFECARLLAAADGRLAQELMRWRRESYKVSLHADSLNLAAKALTLVQAADVHQPFSPVAATSAIQSMINPIGPIADPYEINIAQQSIGMDPSILQQAWQLSSQQEAINVLGGNAGTLGAEVNAPVQTARENTTIDAVAADTASLNRLSGFRSQLLDNASTTLKGQ